MSNEYEIILSIDANKNGYATDDIIDSYYSKSRFPSAKRIPTQVENIIRKAVRTLENGPSSHISPEVENEILNAVKSMEYCEERCKVTNFEYDCGTLYIMIEVPYSLKWVKE
jgi:hypothetical protein